LSGQVFAFPTSFAQQRLWFLDQLVPGNPFYNIFSALPLRLQNFAALERALNEIVRRHEALRTTFSISGDKPMQVVAPALTLSVPVIDLRNLPVAERGAEVQRLAEEESRRPFDLARGPLLRATVLKQTDIESVLLLTIHHIVSDGWSVGILFRELTALYQAFATGRPAGLPELRIQYADFAVWQRDWLKGDLLKQQLVYWQHQLEDMPILQLPTDRTRPATKSYRGARVTIALPEDLSRHVKELSQAEGVTLFMTLLGAFQILLHRYTGQENIVIGSPVAGRNREEIEGLIGFFVNTLVIRTDFTGDPTFRELLQRVREVATQAYAHQDLPFEMLVEVTQPTRDLSRNPLFQVIFQLLNAPSSAPPAREEAAASAGPPPLIVHSGTAKFDLEFSLWDSQQGLSGYFEFSTDLFDESTIVRMADHFRTLLGGVIADPGVRISRLPLLTESERKQAISLWNQTRTDYPREHCVHQLFEQQVERTPDAVAIVDQDQWQSYRALNQRANAIAHRLQSLGVGPGVLVAVCMERSANMVSALLAVLKAGGAYVPIDPDYPNARRAFMLADTEALVLVTERRFVDRLPVHTAKLMCLDTDGEQLDDGLDRNPASAVTSADLAYVMYTSGSTGTPKGVCIPHRAINRLVLNTDYVVLDSFDRVAHISNTSFDAATFEIWGPLLCGGRTVVIPRHILLSPMDFAAELRRQNITAMFITAALFNQVASEDPRAFQSLRHVLVGGSAVDPKWAREVLEHGAPGRLLNVYGPTESTTFAAWYHVESVSDGASTIPIGRPLANTELYVLDPHRNLVPVGVPGELYIGGDGLATGYLKRALLTEEKFVPHPFSADAQARLYRTGDLVRRRLDGNVEFLGRIDDQVKIRGFRVELGEIEAVLEQHPAVQDAVLIARAEADGDKRLVAYVVPNPQSGPESPGLLTQEQLGNWQAVFDDHVYGRFADGDDPTFNITGWNSSYTGLPIPEPDMREWLDDTVERILALKPTKVLEIGCGTGLLLFRIAPHCSTYCGTDFSVVALDCVRGVMAQPGRSLPQVELVQRTAEDFSDIDESAFDMVIINSVVQYFPNVDYLQRVLDGAIRAVRPGGYVFIGDVRSEPLLKALHASIQFASAEASVDIATVAERCKTEMARETELLIKPGFFTSLPHRNPAVGRVELFPKRGHARNELTKFRYQVLIHIGEYTGAWIDPEWVEWDEQKWDIARLRRLLEDAQPDIVGLAHVANARLSAETLMLNALDSEESAAAAASLRELVAVGSPTGINPQDLWWLENDLPYRVFISWARHDIQGRYDVVLVRRNSSSGTPGMLRFPIEGVARRGLSHYANNPSRRETARHLVPQLRAYLTDQLPEFMIPSVFVVLGALPLTPNGKVDRKALPAPDGPRPELQDSFVAPRNEIEQILTRIWCEVLANERVGVHDNFFELGGDSILSIQIIARARRAGVQLRPQQIFQHQTIAELAPMAEKLVNTLGDQGVPRGDVPLTPIQTWFIEQELREPHHFNQSSILAVSPATDTAFMRQSVGHLLRHHDALRLRLVRDQFGWRQFYAEPDDDIPFTEMDLRNLPVSNQAIALENEAKRLHGSLDLAAGPLARVVLFRLDKQKGDRLLIVIHHLAVDAVSWRILLEDLLTCYGQASRGDVLSLSDKTTSFQRWAQRLRQHATSASSSQELSFWLQGPLQAVPLPIDRRQGENTVVSARTLEVALSPDETQALLQEVSAAYRTQINEALLSALAQALAKWLDSPTVLFDLEGHGREDLFEGFDLSRTVGWFTSIFPVWLSLKRGASPGDVLKSVKEQLRRIPNRGVGYGVLRYLSEDAALMRRLATLPQAELSFNYLGQFNSKEAFGEVDMTASESSGPPRSPLDDRPYLVEIKARVERGSLCVDLTYSENYHRGETIAEVAGDFIEALRALIRDCRGGESNAYTPSDFPDLKLSQEELNTLLASLGGNNVASS
jgi:amino acid adenylation domain-containing protein/non-ribosomal peptide synthase protein (TIGR01720 family)